MVNCIIENNYPNIGGWGLNVYSLLIYVGMDGRGGIYCLLLLALLGWVGNELSLNFILLRCIWGNHLGNWFFWYRCDGMMILIILIEILDILGRWID